MKKLGVFVAVLGFTVGFLLTAPAAAEEAEGLSFTPSVSYWSKYVGPYGATFYDKGVVQGEVAIEHAPSGAHLTVWGSYSPDSEENFGDELDLIAGVTRTVGPAEIDLGVAYYDVVQVGNFGGDDLYALTLSVAFPELVAGLTPCVSVEADFPYADGGLSYKAGVSRKFFEILEADVSVGGHDGAFGLEPELVSFARGTLSATFALGKLEIAPQVNYQLGFGGDEGLAEENNFWWGVNFSLPL